MAKMAKKCVRPSKMTKIATFWTTFWTPILTFSKNTVKSSNISHQIWVTSRRPTKRSSKVGQKRLFHVFGHFKKHVFLTNFLTTFLDPIFHKSPTFTPLYWNKKVTKKWQKTSKTGFFRKPQKVKKLKTQHVVKATFSKSEKWQNLKNTKILIRDTST